MAKRPSRKKTSGGSVGIGPFRIGTDYLSKHNVRNDPKDGRFSALRGGGLGPFKVRAKPVRGAAQRLALGVGLLGAMVAGSLARENPRVKAVEGQVRDALLRAKSAATGRKVRRVVTKKEGRKMWSAARRRWGFSG